MTFSYEEALEASLAYYDGDGLAAKAFVDKYALRDKEGALFEATPQAMHERLARELARVEAKYPNGRSLEEIFHSLERFRYLVPQGSPMYGIGNPYSLVSLSNCFVIASPDDTMSSIIDCGKDMANIMKRRGGVGIDISQLRPDGVEVNNAARTSSGAWSFADFFSYICRMVGQNARRGALMISIDVRHPDIFKFATMKLDKSKVTGANVSIRVTDAFMKAVEDDTEFTLQWPVESETPTVVKVIKARELWDVLISSVHSSAEPGLLMWDTIIRELPAESYAADGFKTISVNPCGEINLSKDDACRLMALNLHSFVVNGFQKTAYFDFALFEEQVRLGMRLMDDVVDLELECVERIAAAANEPSECDLWNRIYQRGQTGRRTGLGTFGLADALACLGLRYDSDEALVVIDKIYEALKVAAYRESINLAKERGAFPIWDWNKESDCPFIQRLPEDLLAEMAVVGRRNISILTNAPTGTVSICSFNSSSGIEPVFRNAYKRRKKINAGDENTTVDFVDHLGDKWQEFYIFHRNVSDWIKMNVPDWDGISAVDLPDYFVTSDQIDWQQRVKIQGAIQKHIDHSISATINLPATVTVSEVSKLYLNAWKEGLKGITIYVDGSRTGVLVVDDNKDKSGRPTTVVRTQAPKRPETVLCDIHHVTVYGEPWVIMVGLLKGEPYEIFGGYSEDITIPRSIKSGYLNKTKISKGRNRYDLVFQHGDHEVVVSDVSNLFQNKNYGSLTRTLSLALRHGAPVQHIVEQLGKDENEELLGFSKVISRVLKKYIADGVKVSGKGCDQCGSANLRFQDGCPICLSCGYSKCS